MVVGLPKAMSAIAFKPPSGARWRVLSEKEKVSYDSSGKTRMSRTQVNDCWSIDIRQTLSEPGKYLSRRDKVQRV